MILRVSKYLLPIFLLCFGLLASGSVVQARSPKTSDPIIGFWYTEGKEGGVQIYPCRNDAKKMCGRLYWLGEEKDGADQTPAAPGMRGSKCRLQFMRNFTPDGQGRYLTGEIDDVRDGGTYSAEMTLVDKNTLDLRGYLWLPVLGRSQTWTRAKTMTPCTSG